MNNPPDLKVRSLVTATPPRSHWLSAGAGAGKTEILVTRIANLIAAGFDPAKIIAITFTEKAAGDLKKRVMQRLRNDAKMSANGLPEQFHGLQQMFVGTIHSLARRVVRNAPLTAGIEPDPEILDGVTADKRIRQAIRSWQR
ncbi:MAG: UvrD-helicase domain-containing protein, partial [bacterium]|nr:UvrD-helicase domain-containing protein [bacterium]